MHGPRVSASTSISLARGPSRQRPRAWLLAPLIAGPLALGACARNDGGAAASATEGEGTGIASLSEGSSTTADESTSTGAVSCVPSEDFPFVCPLGAPCIFGECAPYSQACPHEFDGFCDEGGLCAPGTDPFDCCATPENGVCEEKDRGGSCPLGSDFWDCGKCATVNNDICDEGTTCPPGSDPADCCATPENGVCEAECLDPSDWLDCGEPCPFDLTPGKCDEYPGGCPIGTDPDCCANEHDGVCEEEGKGGSCPAGTDGYDCGECMYTEDGVCDEPAFCAPGTDSADCCPTWMDGTCDEHSAGGPCPPGTDYFDCGTCPWDDNGVCDEPDRCPPGSDSDECP